MQTNITINLDGVQQNIDTTHSLTFNPFLGQLNNNVHATNFKVSTTNGHFFFSLELLSINLNIAKGAISARYRAVVDKEALAGNNTITGFAFNGDGGTQQAAIMPLPEPFTLVEDKLIVMVNLSVDMLDMAVNLLPLDDNFFAKWLLGNVAISTSQFTIKRGTSLIGLDASIGDSFYEQETRPNDANIVSDNFNISYDEPDNLITDLTVLASGNPILRVPLHTVLEKQFSFLNTVNSENILGVSTLTLSKVLTLNQTGNSVQLRHVELVKPPRRFIKNIGPVMLNFDSSTKLISDPSNRCGAFATETEAYLTNVTRGRPQVIARLATNGASVHLPYYNEIALLYPNKLELYNFSSEDGLKLVHTINFLTIGSGQAAITRRGNDILIIRQINEGRHWERGFFNGTSYTPVESRAISGDVLLFRNRYHIAAISYTKGEEFWKNISASCWGRDLDTVVTPNLTRFLNAHQIREVADALDGLVHVHTTSGGIPFSTLYMPNSDMAHLMGTNSKISLSGDYSIKTNPDGQKQAVYFFRDSMHIGLFSLEDMQSVTAAVRIGNFLIVRRENGTIEDYAIDPLRNAIYHPFLTVGVQASGTARGYTAHRVPGTRRLLLTFQNY